MEKTRLIDEINQPASGFTTAGNASLPPYADDKDTKLESILKINQKEIDAANESEWFKKKNDIRFTQQENTDSDVFFMIDEEYKDVLRTATWRPLPTWSGKQQNESQCQWNHHYVWQRLIHRLFRMVGEYIIGG